MVFVADVHLRPDRPDRTDRFLRFLESLRGEVGCVYVLGDLFDVWVSPRQDRHPDYRAIVDRIGDLVGGGLRIEFVQGNRDFLVGRRFERRTGVRVHEDPTEAEIAGRRVLLTHGDLLCAADHAYQRTRKVLRSRICRWLASLLPVRWTFAIGALLRRYSDRAVRKKDDATLEPTDEAVLGFVRRGYEAIVCGHLHRAQEKWYETGARRCLLVSVGDWEETGSFAEMAAGSGPRIRQLAEEGNVVTIDGPSGAGKSTVARRLAEKLGWTYLDTGAMYRGIAWKVLDAGEDPTNREAVERIAGDVDLSWSEAGNLVVDGREVALEIRSAEVTAAVSPVSAHPGVRRAMVRRQREAAHGRDVVVEGRDIGSVVFPQARYRFYLDATPRERARRRTREIRERGEPADENRVLADLEARDRYDSTRADSPLRFEEGMDYVDTTGLSVNEVVEELARKVLAS